MPLTLKIGTIHPHLLLLYCSFCCCYCCVVVVVVAVRVPPGSGLNIYVMRSGKTRRMSQNDILRNGLK